MNKGLLFDYILDVLQNEELSLWDLVLTDPEEFANFDEAAETWDDEGSWLSRIVSKMFASYDTKE